MIHEPSVAAAHALLAWATAEGADVAPVTAAASPLGGLGVFAAKDVAAGQQIMCSPLRLVLRASMALSDPVIGFPLTTMRRELGAKALHDRLLICLLLLHLRRQGPSGFFAPYLAALPGDARPLAALGLD